MELLVRHVDELTGQEKPDAAVVIDVVRAFTVAPWVLMRGAAQLFAAPDVAAAAAARRAHPEALLLKDGGPDPRFALPNAPGRIAREDLAGRTVIQVTGNGTRGVFAVGRVPLLLCASFVTAMATARAVAAAAPRRLLLVPTEGDEDVALAEYLGALLDGGAPLDSAPYLERVVASAAGRECAERGPDPRYPGFDPDDLRRCVELDACDRAVRARASSDPSLVALTLL